MMPRKPKKVKVRRTYDKENLQKAIQAVKNNQMSVRKAAREFAVPKSTVSNHISGRVLPGATSGFQQAIPEAIETRVAIRVKEAGKMGFGVTRGQLCLKVGRVVKKLGLKTPFRNGVPGKDWVAGFMKRHPDISLRSPTPLNTVRARMLNPAVAARYFADLGQVMTDLGLHDSPTRVWNIDETNVSLTHKPTRVLAELGQKNVPGRVGNSRDGITVLACVNAAGKDIPPLVIVKGQTDKCLRAYNVSQGPPGCKYTYQKKAWMEDVLGVCWFRDHFLRHCGPERPQLILLDSHSSHETLSLVEEARANNITLLALPPHTTQYLNPLDKTIFGPFQREYNKQCTEFMSQSPNNLVTKWEWSKLFKSAYIKTVNPENIIKGFEVCGIFPFNADRVPASAYAPSKPFDQVHMQNVMSASSHTQRDFTASVSEEIADATETVTLTMSQTDPVPPSLETVTVSLPVSDTGAIPQDCTVIASAGSDGLISLDDPQALFDLILQGEIEIVGCGARDSTDPCQSSPVAESSFANTGTSSTAIEVDKAFSLPNAIKTEKKVHVKKLTSHRLLTSDEVIQKKRKELEVKNELARVKEERKLLRIMKAEQKQEGKAKQVKK